MSRGLSNDMETAIDAASMGLAVLFAELDFSSGFVRVHTSLGTISWRGNDWLGVGSLGNVSAVEESAELQRRTLSYTLSGIPNSLIAIVLGENYQGREAKLYLGIVNPTTGQLVDTPILIDRGKMDISDIEEGESCTVTVTAENRIAGWDRPLVRRYTDSDHQSRFLGDIGLQFVDQAAQKEINWGRKTE